MVLLPGGQSRGAELSRNPARSLSHPSPLAVTAHTGPDNGDRTGGAHMPEAVHLADPSGDYQCLHEFIPAARAKVTSNTWGYLIGATETETTMRRNRMALDSIAFRPRVCRD